MPASDVLDISAVELLLAQTTLESDTIHVFKTVRANYGDGGGGGTEKPLTVV